METKDSTNDSSPLDAAKLRALLADTSLPEDDLDVEEDLLHQLIENKVTIGSDDLRYIYEMLEVSGSWRRRLIAMLAQTKLG